MTAGGAGSVLNLAQLHQPEVLLCLQEASFLLSKRQGHEAASLPAPFGPGVGILSPPAQGLCDPLGFVPQGQTLKTA